jgi:uncharacterized membrane protein
MRNEGSCFRYMQVIECIKISIVFSTAFALALAQCCAVNNIDLLLHSNRYGHRHYYHHHHHVTIKELGHLLTRSGLTWPGVSSVVFLGSFYLLGCSFLSVCVICYMAFNLHVVSNFSFFLYFV